MSLYKYDDIADIARGCYFLVLILFSFTLVLVTHHVQRICFWPSFKCTQHL